MDEFKKELFARHHPGKTFPTCCAMNENEMRDIRRILSAKLGLSSDDGLALVQAVTLNVIMLQDQNAEDDQFNLRKVLTSAGVQSLATVCINWYRFDDIDRIALADLSQYFGDVWYPSSDQIEIFDQTLNWILSVADNGTLGLWRFIK